MVNDDDLMKMRFCVTTKNHTLVSLEMLLDCFVCLLFGHLRSELSQYKQNMYIVSTKLEIDRTHLFVVVDKVHLQDFKLY